MRTIPQLFESSVEKYSSNILIREKYEGEYKCITYNALHKEMKVLALALIRLGVNKGDRLSLLAEGSSNWLIAELAILYIGAISVPLSVKINESSDLQFRLDHSGSKYIFVSGVEYNKVKSISNDLDNLKGIILLDVEEKFSQKDILFSELINHSQEFDKTIREEFTKRMNGIQEDDLANISYTSGTTADPKGIMLTHRNYTANVEQACSLFEVPEWYVSLLILSWDHSFAHTTGLYVMIKNGASIAVVDPGISAMDRLKNISKNIREIRPTFQLSVPALARSMKKGIEAGIRSKGKFTEKLFKSALQTAHNYYGDGKQSRAGKFYLKPLLLLYDNIIFSKIRENFGGRLKFIIGGGALLDVELQNFFYAIGIPMFQGYGLTEASPIISSNTPDVHKLGSSGRIVKNLELKILDDDGKPCTINESGEIVVRGENVMKGYWKNEKASAESLREGWLFTGDRGYLDEDQFLYVLGRFKSLLIGNDGEKYSPEGIEEALVDGSSFIDQCMLYNNQNPYTIGLVVLNKKAVNDHLKSINMENDGDEMANEIIRLLKHEIEQYYPDGKHEGLFPERWLPSSVGILHQAFTEENGMINSTLKMVRPNVEENYRSLIEYLYTPEGKNIQNPRNKESALLFMKKEV